MNKAFERTLAAAFTVAVLVSVAVTPAAAASSDDNRVIVIISEDADTEQTLNQLSTDGTVHEKTTAGDVTYVMATIPDSSAVYHMDHVDVGETGTTQLPVGSNAGTGTVKTTTEEQQVPWGVDRIGAQKAADTVQGEDNIDVAVLDTGVDADHDELEHALEWGIRTTGTGDPVEGVDAADDNNGHGTHVAGTLAAEDDNDGVVGVAPNVDVYSVKVLSSSGRGSYSDLIQGINEALAGPDDEVGTEDDADVITMSLGGTTNSPALQHAVQNARDNGAIVVAAVGNAGDGDPSTGEVQYPAKYDAVVGVGATTSDDRPVFFSSEGDDVALGAPGLGVLSTQNGGGLTTKSGSSMGTPHVAGTAALVIAENDQPPTRIEQRMTATAEDILPAGEDRQTGAGLVRADAATGATNASYPPFAVIEHPRRGAEVSGSLTLRLSVTDTEDAAEALDVSVTAANQTADVSFTGEGYTATFDTTRFPEDERTRIVATITDTDGNTFNTQTVVTANNELDPRPLFKLDAVEIPQQTDVGDDVSVQLFVRNEGNGDGVLTGAVYPSERRQPRSFEAPVPAGESRRVSVPITYETAGTYTLRVGFERLNDTIVREIRVAESTSFDRPLDGVPAQGPPTDPDDDGLYEDVNGDGETTFVDSVGLVACSCDNLTEDQQSALDFAANGDVSRQDGIRHAAEFVETNKTVPSDPDDDGLYEDVNGDGQATAADVQTFYTGYEDARWMQVYGRLLDFEPDDELTFDDVIKLFHEIAGEQQDG